MLTLCWPYTGPIPTPRYVLDMKQHIQYCDATMLDRLLTAKTLLDSVDSRDFRQARDRANPFESIKKEFFGTSRAALKMANLDAIFDFMFTRYHHPSINYP